MTIAPSSMRTANGAIYTDPNTGGKYIYDATYNTWTSLVEQTSSSTIVPAEQGAGQTPNTDDITTEKEAARFLRLTTMGPLLKEIDDLVELGSKSQWISNQISSSYDGSAFSDWNSEDSVVPNPGWFGGIAVKLRPPAGSNDNGTTGFSDYTPFHSFSWMVLNKGFSGNNTVLDNVSFPSAKNIYGLFKAPEKSLLSKVTWILSKIIPVSVPGGGLEDEAWAWSSINYYNCLSRHAFGNYADLLEEITYNLNMSQMLTHLRNRKSDSTGRHPDENYAREIMQLFTIGLYKLNLDGSLDLDSQGNSQYTYFGEDIGAAARVFTGLTRWDLDPLKYYDSSAAAEAEMINSPFGYMELALGIEIIKVTTVTDIRRPALYIQKGKTYKIYTPGTTDFIPYGATSNSPSTQFVATKNADLFIGDGIVEEIITYPVGIAPRLKHYMPWYETGSKVLPNVGITIPANTDPVTNIRMFIEGLINHPSCAPFVAKSLIKLAVTANPSPGYITRVAKVFRDNGKGVVGDLASVWAAIFTDAEANLDITSDVKRGKIKDGYEAYASLIRTFEGTAKFASVPNGTPNARYSIYIDGTFQTQTIIGLNRAYQPGIGAWTILAPSIFSYYSPFYTKYPAENWGIVVPEFGAYAANTHINLLNLLTETITLWGPPNFRSIISGTIDHATYFPNYENIFGSEYNGSDDTSVSRLIQRINLVLCGGNLHPIKIKSIFDVVKPMPVSTMAEKDNRVSVILQLMIRSPEFWIL